jgi:hypothetical protein
MALGPVEETSLASNAQFGVEIALAPTLESWHGYQVQRRATDFEAG